MEIAQRVGLVLCAGALVGVAACEDDDAGSEMPLAMSEPDGAVASADAGTSDTGETPANEADAEISGDVDASMIDAMTWGCVWGECASP